MSVKLRVGNGFSMFGMELMLLRLNFRHFRTRKQFHQSLYILKEHLYPGRFYAHCLVLGLSCGFSQTSFQRKYCTCKRIFIGPGSAILLANMSLAYGKALCYLPVEFVFYRMKMAVWLNDRRCMTVVVPSKFIDSQWLASTRPLILLMWSTKEQVTRH